MRKIKPKEKATPTTIGMMIIILIIIVFLGAVTLISFFQEKQRITNPAAVYCEEQGYKIEIRTDAQGNRYGVCIFPDGLECEGWKFYHGECTWEKLKQIKACQSDSDCVAEQCCHPTSCINKEYKPDCSGIVCTEICEIGTIDCGQGSCKCINNQCKAMII